MSNRSLQNHTLLGATNMNHLHIFVWIGSMVVMSVSGMHLCGQHLSDTLELVCRGRGFHVSKKDDGSMSKISEHSRVRRSIVDECCKGSCSLQKLESYCAPGASILSGNLFMRPTRTPSLDSPRRKPTPVDRPTQNKPFNIGQGPALPDTFFWVTPARRDPFSKYIQRSIRSVNQKSNP